MIGNQPITWLIVEAMSLVVFAMCMVHALKQPDYKRKLLELCCFVLGAAIFEHVGVFITKTYDYQTTRIMMVGALPLSTLLIEACTVYTGCLIFEKMKLPKWAALWIVGSWCMLADFGIDPVYVHDKYEFDGVMRGQWNWGYRYDFTFYDIPFFNFSGWLLMCGMYAVLIFVFRGIANKKKGWFDTGYPFIAGLILMFPIAICGFMSQCPITLPTPTANLIYELIILTSHCIISLVLYIKAYKNMDAIDFKTNWVIPATAIILDAYNILVGFGLGIEQSYITNIVVTGMHILLFWLWNKKKPVAK